MKLAARSLQTPHVMLGLAPPVRDALGFLRISGDDGVDLINGFAGADPHRSQTQSRGHDWALWRRYKGRHRRHGIDDGWVLNRV